MHTYHVVSNLIREIKGQSLLARPGPSKFFKETYLLKYSLVFKESSTSTYSVTVMPEPGGRGGCILRHHTYID